MVTTKIKKWGNSYGIRIPKRILEQLNLTPDSDIELREDGQSITLVPIRPVPLLDELLEGITQENLHGEVSTGHAVGVETW